MLIAITRPPVLREPSASESGADDRIALIDFSGKILSVNENWLSFAEQSGATLNSVGPGANYLDVCCRASASSSGAREALRGIGAVLQGKLNSFTMNYFCDSSSAPACF